MLTRTPNGRVTTYYIDHHDKSRKTLHNTASHVSCYEQRHCNPPQQASRICTIGQHSTHQNLGLMRPTRHTRHVRRSGNVVMYIHTRARPPSHQLSTYCTLVQESVYQIKHTHVFNRPYLSEMLASVRLIWFHVVHKSQTLHWTHRNTLNVVGSTDKSSWVCTVELHRGVFMFYRCYSSSSVPEESTGLDFRQGVMLR